MHSNAQSCPTLCYPMDCSPPGSSVYVHGDSPGKNTGVGCHVLLQGIFPTQGSNSGLPQCRQILYCLNHEGSPRVLVWVAYPFSKRSARPLISWIADGFFTSCTTREALLKDIFRSQFYQPNSCISSYLEKYQILHADGCSSWLTNIGRPAETFWKNMCLSASVPPSQKNHISTFSSASLEQFFRAIWGCSPHFAPYKT